MRNALILLAVVALLILAVGAFNNGTAFDIDYVAGTASSVSLLWVSAVLAALVFVVGLAAAWFAQAAMTGSRRKLEAELQSTYERLREAEALAARPAPAAAAPAAETVAATVVAEREDETVVAEPEAATVVETEVAAVVAGEAATVESDEAAVVVPDEAVTVVAEEPVVEGPAGGEPAAETIPGEQTAITMAGTPPDDASSEAPAGESDADGPEADAAGRPGQSSS